LSFIECYTDENTQRAVETVDQQEDDYSGLMEDGLGAEGGDGDDFIDSERDDASVTGANIQDRFALPHWLSVAFKAQLEEANNGGGDGLPQLYSAQKTFWFPQQLTYFLLRKHSVTSQDLYNLWFFYGTQNVLLLEGLVVPSVE
jgi:hypothetical protein